MTTIRLPYPISGNRYWRVNRQTARPYKSDEARAYIEEVGWLCAAAGLVEPTAATVALALHFHHAAGRRLDLDNGVKVLLDALQGFAYADDKQVVRLEAEIVEIAKGAEPYVLVTIAPCAARIAEAS